MSNFKLINGNMLEELDKLDENSIDSIVTDPPYELNFMGKGWDNAGVSFNKETWEKCLRVLKPGGHLLAFGGSRTAHRIACAIEDAGFEIRDTIMWLYGSGFPKSMNIGLEIDKRNGVESPIVDKGKSGVSSRAYQSEETTTAGNYAIREAQNKWKGWGTQLKPSYEPIIVARKPVDGSIIENIEKYGVGGINIDECRVEHNEPIKTTQRKGIQNYGDTNWNFDTTKNNLASASPDGRFPANTILTYDETNKDEVIGGFPYTNGEIGRAGRKSGGEYDASSYKVGVVTDYGFKDEGSAARYFYCAKASVKDRDEGLDYLIPKKVNDGRNTPIDNPFQRGETLRKNIHPTVKPVELMQYLVRLVTPNGGTILDPFMGSGSTGKAVMYENNEKDKNYTFIGIELEKEYYEIANARISYANGDIVIKELDENNNVVTKTKHIEKQKRLF